MLSDALVTFNFDSDVLDGATECVAAVVMAHTAAGTLNNLFINAREAECLLNTLERCGESIHLGTGTITLSAEEIPVFGSLLNVAIMAMQNRPEDMNDISTRKCAAALVVEAKMRMELLKLMPKSIRDLFGM